MAVCIIREAQQAFEPRKNSWPSSDRFYIHRWMMYLKSVTKSYASSLLDRMADGIIVNLIGRHLAAGT